LSLAKYLFISGDEHGKLNCHDIETYLTYVFERLSPERDLHFYTKTSIDTLDYSGEGLNEGSKVVLAAYGNKSKELITSLPAEIFNVKGVLDAQFILPGVIMIKFNAYTNSANAKKEISEFIVSLKQLKELNGIAQIVLFDDFDFGKNKLQDYLWVTYTRSNPSHDIYGVDELTENKHWGCKGALIFDSRKKPHHAPELKVDSKAAEKADLILKNYLK
jgi:4-hydroxy-3-polyprenylbenzoate decarboxylase